MESPLNEHWLPKIRANFEKKPVEELAAIYAKHDEMEWSPEAFQVIRDLFAERHLALPQIQPKPEPKAPKPRVVCICGFGTSYVGERDFRRDYSFITTHWLILFGLPVYPFRSLRVRRYEDEPRRIRFGPVWRANYQIDEVMRPHLKQVLCVYAYLLLFALLLAACTATKDESLWRMGFLLLLLVPHLMRYFAKRRAGL
jgi:hypothetical protein